MAGHLRKQRVQKDLLQHPGQLEQIDWDTEGRTSGCSKAGA